MRHFGITQKLTRDRKHYLKKISKTYFVLLIFCFSFFSFYDKLTGLIFAKDKIDIVKENLRDVAFYFWNFDKSLSKTILGLDDIIQSYIKGENVLQTREDEIEKIWLYIKKNKNYLSKLGFSNYNAVFDVMSKLWLNKDEIFDLMGKNQEFNYLVILQNTNEKRPNGGFFGSFAFVSFASGHIKDLEVVDAYYPDFIANKNSEILDKTYIPAPERTRPFLPETRIGFIAANKFGFTDMDGKNIKTLYEKIFNESYNMDKVKMTMTPNLYDKLLHKNIKGVIFLRTDLFEEILPGFGEKVREWQFLNASVNLIRGEERGNKKEMYINQIKEFFDKSKGIIAKNLLNNFDKILEKNLINLYISNASTGLNDFLISSKLTNTYTTGYIYAWDTNNSFNKVDGFIIKNIQIHDEAGKILIDTHNDIVDIRKLQKGVYRMRVYYTLNVPAYYYKFVEGLEKKYGITLGDRERGIMALKQARYTPESLERRRESKSTIYFPPNFNILSYGGDYFAQSQFDTDFSNGFFYQMRIAENNVTKTVQVKFEVK